MVELLINKFNVDILKKTDNGSSCLHWAAYGGQKHICEYLIENKKVNIDDIDTQKNTPMMYACIVGSLEVVEYLIKVGGNIKALNEDNRTPLLYAARYGHYEICKLIIDITGIDYMKFKDSGGNDCIKIATNNSHLKTATKLKQLFDTSS